MRISWPQLKYDREYFGKLSLNTPYGYCSMVRYWDSFTLENRYDYTYMNYAMSEWMERVEKDYGSVPTGEYTFEFFWMASLRLRQLYHRLVIRCY